MQGRGIGAVALKTVLGPEAAGVGVVIAGAEVIEAEVGVVLFTSEQIIVHGAAAVVEQVAEGVVIVDVRDVRRGIGQVADVVVAIVAVKAS